MSKVDWSFLLRDLNNSDFGTFCGEWYIRKVYQPLSFAVDKLMEGSVIQMIFHSDDFAASPFHFFHAY